MSVQLVSLWTEVRKRLEAAGVASPVFDARLLLEAGAGVSRLDIVTDPRRELTAEQVANVLALADRRAAREPVAHITGLRHFWKQELRVSPDVLIPRPETEYVVEAALERLPFAQPARVLDLGVGSGAILFAILADRPLATGLGVDLSADAIAVAMANAAHLGLGERVSFLQNDWTKGLQGPFDLVVSNPPYIATAEIEGLAPEVARFEPRLALDGGADGLDAYRLIIPALPLLLQPGGGFALEIGKGQEGAVTDLAARAGFTDISYRNDLAGIPRVVTGVRPAAT
ncbi:MAG: peptide chain release factor N(5)-glutamine methyltransferase [Hyphomonadaceae bacterium]|nr:peptide chain release factor N(5)-glutamine methyltransferase [Hyphomonadaceae bacterium]